MRSHVDLKRFAFRLWPDKVAVERAMGLAKLTALVLKKQLDKTQQVHNSAPKEIPCIHFPNPFREGTHTLSSLAQFLVELPSLKKVQLNIHE